LLGRHLDLARDPVVDVVVAGTQDALVLVQFCSIEPGNMGARELAKKNVVLLVAAIDAAIEQTLSPRLQFGIGTQSFPQAARKGA